jgi:hypothetical protein
MRRVFANAPDEDKITFDRINQGVTHFHWGSHPSAEGVLQLIAGDEPYKVFGPTYNRAFTAFALKWGLFALLGLLEELQFLRPQDAVPQEERLRLEHEYKRWQMVYNEEFLSDEQLLDSRLTEDGDDDRTLC